MRLRVNLATFDCYVVKRIEEVIMKIEPTDQMPDRINRNADQVVKDAVTILYINGFLTKEECSNVDGRVNKWEKDYYREANKEV